MTVLDITERMRKAQGSDQEANGSEARDDYGDIFDAFRQPKKH
jgi:hypothetical protein